MVVVSILGLIILLFTYKVVWSPDEILLAPCHGLIKKFQLLVAWVKPQFRVLMVTWRHWICQMSCNFDMSLLKCHPWWHQVAAEYSEVPELFYSPIHITCVPFSVLKVKKSVACDMNLTEYLLIRFKSSKFILAFIDYFPNYFYYVFTCMDELFNCLWIRMAKVSANFCSYFFGELTISNHRRYR